MSAELSRWYGSMVRQGTVQWVSGFRPYTPGQGYGGDSSLKVHRAGEAQAAAMSAVHRADPRDDVTGHYGVCLSLEVGLGLGSSLGGVCQQTRLRQLPPPL